MSARSRRLHLLIRITPLSSCHVCCALGCRQGAPQANPPLLNFEFLPCLLPTEAVADSPTCLLILMVQLEHHDHSTVITKWLEIWMGSRNKWMVWLTVQVRAEAAAGVGGVHGRHLRRRGGAGADPQRPGGPGQDVRRLPAAGGLGFGVPRRRAAQPPPVASLDTPVGSLEHLRLGQAGTQSN